MALDLPKKLTVVVADRAHAYLYETVLDGAQLARIATFDNPSGRAHEQDLVSSAPGRTFNRSAGVHQAYEPKHKTRDQAALRFAHVLGRALSETLAVKKSRGVVLIAAPRMLSQIKHALPKAVQAQVVKEIAKDLVHQPKRVIAEHLRAA